MPETSLPGRLAALLATAIRDAREGRPVVLSLPFLETRPVLKALRNCAPDVVAMLDGDAGDGLVSVVTLHHEPRAEYWR